MKDWKKQPELSKRAQGFSAHFIIPGALGMLPALTQETKHAIMVPEKTIGQLPERSTGMENRITDIHCPQCGAPAEFNIVQQRYLCEYCGGRFETGIAQKEKLGFRRL